ncbi:TPA: hypothetical protein RNY37_000002 [Pasteurella multocida]|uniref:hypothetical protein n=1 Tax=Pasteurella multocida TaxID=747 RepID=UPI00287A14F1|nr:hypothetical protein [Pasteurella multocida]MDT8767831.1 hypothetical protein [Pasteurella multocida]MDY0579221.1 hypothetical protein [Pasteurella multocida]HDR1230126.1 hypothetical protein [Pasteurella multocida]HDR1238676.1 hypothetical protein [Pasteurella multocida]HDX1191602.1 hypothetical protein [Pasteurella multocida]
MKFYFNDIIKLIIERAMYEGLSKDKLNKMKDQDDFLLFGMDYLENDTDSQFFLDLNELEVLLERAKSNLNENNLLIFDSDLIRMAIVLQNLGNYFIYLNEDIRLLLNLENVSIKNNN